MMSIIKQLEAYVCWRWERRRRTSLANFSFSPPPLRPTAIFPPSLTLSQNNFLYKREITSVAPMANTIVMIRYPVPPTYYIRPADISKCWIFEYIKQPQLKALQHHCGPADSCLQS